MARGEQVDATSTDGVLLVEVGRTEAMRSRVEAVLEIGGPGPSG